MIVDDEFGITSADLMSEPPPPRPTSDRAAWLMSAVSAVGRRTVDASQYEELRGEACALRAEVKALRAENREPEKERT